MIWKDFFLLIERSVTTGVDPLKGVWNCLSVWQDLGARPFSSAVDVSAATLGIGASHAPPRRAPRKEVS